MDTVFMNQSGLTSFIKAVETATESIPEYMPDREPEPENGDWDRTEVPVVSEREEAAMQSLMEKGVQFIEELTKFCSGSLQAGKR